MKTLFTTLFAILLTAVVMAQCGQPVTYEGQSYPTVQIGSQCWFAKNLNVGSMAAANNTVSNNKNLNNTQVIEKYCYGNLPAKCNELGALYTWGEAMSYDTVEGARGICPEGWHIPTLAEYTEMLDALGGIEAAGESMKAISPQWYVTGYNATNSSGFNAIPGGIRYHNGIFYFQKLDLNFWLSSVPPPDSRNPYPPAYYGGVSWGNIKANLGQFYKVEALSARCIKN